MRSLKKIECKKQHTPQTCGIACIMTVLHFFGKGNCPSIGEEARLYKKYGCKALGKGTLASAIFRCFLEHGLDTALYHSAKEYLTNEDHCIPEDQFIKVLEEYKEELGGIQDPILIETGFQISTSWYKEQLEKGFLLLVEYVLPTGRKAEPEQIHWLILYGYEKGSFLVCDPRPGVGKTRLLEEEVAENTQTPIGSICIAVKERMAGPSFEG